MAYANILKRVLCVPLLAGVLLLSGCGVLRSSDGPTVLFPGGRDAGEADGSPAANGSSASDSSTGTGSAAASGDSAETGTSSANAANAKPVAVSFLAMDTLMGFTVYGSQDAASGARDLITDLERQISTTDQDSDIWHINTAGSGPVTPETAHLLARALELCRETDGALDLSIYPVVRAWGFTAEEYRIPSAEELQTLLEQVDYTKIRLLNRAGDAVTAPEDTETGSVFFVSLPEGMKIDLGSVAKGYAGAVAAAYLRENGVTSAMLNLGGNVQTVGAKPDGSPWRVGIQDPSSDQLAGVLDIRDLAVVTSGGYQRYFTGDDGTVYWHIMDPSTGSPARSGLLSVTIAAEDGTLCDALSTALFVMGEQRAADFWRNHQNFEMVLITDDARIIITPGLTFHDMEAGYTLEVLKAGDTTPEPAAA